MQDKRKVGGGCEVLEGHTSFAAEPARACAPVSHRPPAQGQESQSRALSRVGVVPPPLCCFFRNKLLSCSPCFRCSHPTVVTPKPVVAWQGQMPRGAPSRPLRRPLQSTLCCRSPLARPRPQTLLARKQKANKRRKGTRGDGERSRGREREVERSRSRERERGVERERERGRERDRDRDTRRHADTHIQTHAHTPPCIHLPLSVDLQIRLDQVNQAGDER